MNGFSFHAEMPEGRGSKNASKGLDAWTRATLERYASEGRFVNCLAVSTDRRHWFGSSVGGGMMKEAIGSVTDGENSATCSASASVAYIQNNTVRISEALARKLHPRLFINLDD